MRGPVSESTARDPGEHDGSGLRGGQRRPGNRAWRLIGAASQAPRSLLLGNAMTTAAAVVAGAVLTVLVVYLAMMQPRLERIVSLTAVVIESLRTLTATAEPQQIERLRQALGEDPYRGVVMVRPEEARFTDPEGLLERRFMQMLRARVPDYRLSYSGGDRPGIWFEVPVANGKSIWLSWEVERIPLARYLVPALVLGALLAAVVVTVWLRVNLLRPMRALDDAVRMLGDGDPSRPLPLPRTTEFAALTDRFNRMTERLREFESDRSLLLASISHDLRTPLAKLRLGLALQGGETRIDPQVTRQLDVIERIVSQFVDYAQAGQGSETPVLADLNDLVREVAAGFELDGSGFELTLQPLPSLPLQPISMQRAMSNLMANAVRYGREGLQIRTALTGDRISLQVLDRGPGVEPGELAALGRPFMRTAAAQGVGPGTGLGLAIARRIVEAHGGRMVIGNRAGNGFMVSIELPTRGIGSVGRAAPIA